MADFSKLWQTMANLSKPAGVPIHWTGLDSKFNHKISFPLDLIALLTALVILTVLAVLSGVIYRTEYVANKKPSPPDVPGLSVDFCKPGECVTSMATGIKRCPYQETDSMFVDHATEACNPPFKCTNPKTPHPVGLNGETLPGERCPPGVQCSCSAATLCSKDRASVFRVGGGIDELSRVERVEIVAAEQAGRHRPKYRLLCSLPVALGVKAFGCQATSAKSRLECFAGKKGAEACPYGTLAVGMHSIDEKSSGDHLMKIPVPMTKINAGIRPGFQKVVLHRWFRERHVGVIAQRSPLPTGSRCLCCVR